MQYTIKYRPSVDESWGKGQKGASNDDVPEVGHDHRSRPFVKWEMDCTLLYTVKLNANNHE